MLRREGYAPEIVLHEPRQRKPLFQRLVLARKVEVATLTNDSRVQETWVEDLPGMRGWKIEGYLG